MNARATIAVIPLRAGSKGLPGKNTRPLAGRPLYGHAIAQAHAAGITRVVISTDIEELIGRDLAPGITVLPRPAELAGDEVPMDAVLTHILSHGVTGPAQVVLLQATSPLRQGGDITAAMDLYDTGEFDLVLSATQANSGVLKWGRRGEGGQFVPLSDPAHCFANRASLPPVYRPNGAVYVFDADWFRRSGTLAGGRIGMIEMPPERAHDIDTLADFETVEALLDGGSAADD
ncbi:MAG: acylneuraminate cytidylyltransferase family protein [Sediminimonas qiaohouensis]|uniref:Acylneuraminate cytidylyltransferase family protein n=1 Tax=Sediminimonas qiaohouensis TaxID=552061 RepID=A0A7C9HA71_9RHOB|nr:acylneuraminate cytidylyltransferase family protein [Sediminimonas qiaohouensis]MTJ03844.1 acylneuraminate cytidylyltransferase family protein [Sediminimonas qiaohouensis]